jgi:hypothetical protein
MKIKQKLTATWCDVIVADTEFASSVFNVFVYQVENLVVHILLGIFCPA